jgi:hypothetical protein
MTKFLKVVLLGSTIDVEFMFQKFAHDEFAEQAAL